MRQNTTKTSKHVRTVNTARFFALTVCCVLTFGFALSSDIFGGGLFSGSGGTAFAGAAYYKGGTKQIAPDGYVGDLADITAEEFGFSVDSFWSGKTAWAQAYEYKRSELFAPVSNEGSTQGPNEGYWSIAGESDWFDWATTKVRPIANGWQADLDNYWSANGVGMAVNLNYQVPKFWNEISAKYPNIKAYVTADFKLTRTAAHQGTAWQKASYKFQLTDTPIHANNGGIVHVTEGGDASRHGYTVTEIQDGASQDVKTSKMEITPQNTNLMFSVRVGDTGYTENLVNVTNFVLTYSLEFTHDGIMKDGEAPRFDGTDANNTAPYFTSTDSVGRPVWYDTKGFQGILKPDSTADNGSKISLNSFMSQYSPYGKVPAGLGFGNDINFYKKLKISYADYYNSTGVDADGNPNAGGSPLKGNANNAANVSGFKMFSIGEAVDGNGKPNENAAFFEVFNERNITNTSGQTYNKAIWASVDSGGVTTLEIVGYAEVVFENKSNVSIQIYFTQNVKGLRLRGCDYDGKAVNTLIDVTGITDQKPALPSLALEDNFLGGIETDMSKLLWYYSQFLNNGADDNRDEGAMDTTYAPAPYIWFYTVQKSMSENALSSLGVTRSQLLNDFTPFAYKQFSTFSYNFIDGKANGIGNPNISGYEKCTGAGYYLFTFYVMDAAGNVCDANGNVITDDGEVRGISYKMRADYEKPTYGAELGFKNPYTNSDENIYSPTDSTHDGAEFLKNGAWANGALKLKMQFTQNLSGNMVLFSTPDGEENFITISNGTIININGNAIYNGNSVNYKGIVISIKNIGDEGARRAEIVFVYCSQGGDENALGNSMLEDYITTFAIYGGIWQERDDAPSYNGSDAWYYTDSKGKKTYGIYIRVDLTAPSVVTILDKDDSYLTRFNDDIPTPDISLDNRKWYTSGGEYKGFQLQVDLEENYSKEIFVYMGTKFITDSSDPFMQNTFLKDYKKLKPSDYATYFQGNELSTPIPMSEFLKGDGYYKNAVISLPVTDVGMRVVYLWTLDQAGNVGNISYSYILVDGTTYTISAEVSGLGYNNATINDKTSSNFRPKRGTSVTFELSTANGYVPYIFRNKDNTSSIIIKNSTSDAVYSFYDQAPGYASVSGQTITILIDDGTLAINKPLFGNSDNGNVITTVNFEFLYRKVIEINLLSKSGEYYGGDPVLLDVVTTGMDGLVDAGAVKYFEALVNGNGIVDGDKTLLKTVGNYNIQLVFNADDVNYVLRDADAEVIPFSIIPRRITVKTKSLEGVYGDDHNISLQKRDIGFVYEGLSPRDIERLKDNASNPLVHAGTLSLGGALTDYMRVSVGDYQVVQGVKFTLGADATEQANYEIVFVGTTFSIIPRELSVKVGANGKTYKGAEPSIPFDVDITAFASGDGWADTWDTIFTNCNLTFTGTNYVTLVGKNDISAIVRKGGENAGVYKYDTEDSSRFGLNSNYSVKIIPSDTDGVFTISKASVMLDIPIGQVLTLPSTADLGEALKQIAIKYNVEVKFLSDMVGNLGLELQGNGVESGDYIVYTYNIVLGELSGGKNIDLSMPITTVTFIINQVNPDALVLVVSLKDDANGFNGFTKTYGDSWSPSLDAQFDALRFVITNSKGEVVTEYTLSWTSKSPVKVGYSHAEVGTYIVELADVKIWLGNTEVTDKTAAIVPFSVTYNQCDVKVVPTTTNSFRTYGQKDSEYGLSFDLVFPQVDDGMGGKAAFPESLKMTKDDIVGKFVRGIYNTQGDVMRIGEQYDNATDRNGFVLGTAGAEKYAAAVGSDFYIKTDFYKCFSISADKDAMLLLSLNVNPKEIVFSSSDIKGKNKNYDGTKTVFYADGEALDLSSWFVRTSDQVILEITAEYKYSEIWFENQNNEIIIRNMLLSGAESMNYVLQYNNEDGSVSDIAYPISIKYLDYALGDVEGNNIRILEATYILRKSDFRITKQYDGTKAMSASDVKIDDASPLNKLPSKAFANGTYEYPQADVIANFTQGNIVLFFKVANPQGKWDISTTDSDVTIALANDGIRITLSNLPGSITPKVINSDSFMQGTVLPHTREYDATNNVKLDYALKSGVIYSGDNSSFSMVINGIADSKNAATKTPVTIDSALFNAGNNNYTLDTVELNNFYSGSKRLRVTIERVKLIPQIAFNDKVYNDKSDDVYENATSSASRFVAKTATAMTAELISELSNFAFNFSSSNRVALNYGVLNAEGVFNASANVQFGSDGSVCRTDVSVSELSVTSNLSKAEMEAFFENYNFGNSNDVTITGDDSSSSATIGGVIILSDSALILQKEVKPDGTNIKIHDKIYDGNENASVEYFGDEFAGNDKAEVMMVFDGATFASLNVGISGSEVAYQNVVVKGAKFVDIMSGSGISKNYLLKGETTLNGKARIYPAPLSFVENSVKIDEKTYDGNAGLSDPDNVKIKYEFFKGRTDANLVAGLLKNDLTTFEAWCAQANYVDKNVAVKDGSVVAKSANVFGLGVNNNVATGATGQNYKLVSTNNGVRHDEARTDSDIVAVKATVNGTLTLMTYARATNNNYVIESDGYFYSLPKIKNYVDVNDENALTFASEIIGTYGIKDLNGKITEVFVVKDGTVGGGVKTFETKDQVTYFGASGKIKQQALNVKISAVSNSAAFTKYFDGTTRFDGVLGTDFTASELGGLLSIDSAKVTLNPNVIFGSFESAAASSSAKIQFMFNSGTQNALIGDSANNYFVDNKFTTLVGKILQAEIITEVGDISREYGFGTKNDKYSEAIVYFFEYGADGNKTKSELKIVDGALHMKVDDYILAFPGADYPKNNEYVPLISTFTLPNGTANVTSASNVGDYTYKLSGGNASNFKFAPHYTDETNGASKLSITKATLTIHAEGTKGEQAYTYYTRTLLGKTPSITLIYEGFKGSDNSGKVFGTPPTATFKLFDGSAFGDAVDTMSFISSDIGTSFYGVCIEGMERANGNYNVVLKFDPTTEDGVAKMPRLIITLPTINDITVKGADVVYNGSELGRSVVSGGREGDIIDCAYTSGGVAVTNPENVGVYSVSVTIKRQVSLNGKTIMDSQGNPYLYISTATEPVTLTINKAKLGISGKGMAWEFGDKDAVGFNKNDISYLFAHAKGELPKGLDLDKISVIIEVEKLVNGKSVWVAVDGTTPIYHANSYRISLKYDGEGTNYQSENAAVFYYTVSGKQISVKVISNLVQAFVDSQTTTVKYELTWRDSEGKIVAVDEEFAKNIILRYLAGYVGGGQKYVDSISGPGVYDFVVSLKEGALDYPSDYRLLGNVTGKFSVGSTVVNSSSGDVTLGTKDDSIIIANEISREDVYKDTNSSLNADLWDRIAQNVSAQAADGKIMNVDAIIKLTVKFNDKKVDTGTVVMKVKLPSGIDNMDGVTVYGVTKDGKLRQINYTYSNGYITYETDYVDAIAFVTEGKASMEAWMVAVISVSTVLGVLAVGIATLFIMSAAKNKKKKAKALTNNAQGE